jgi:glycosyltransferase involved in cell wall biosynthesis
MRIVIDMQGAQSESRFRGIGRYTISHVQAIVRNRGNNEVFLALSGLFPETIEPIRAAFESLIPQSNIRVWYALGSVRECEPNNHERRMTAELIRESFLASLKPDIIHVTSLFEGYGDDAVTSVKLFDRTSLVTTVLFDLIPLLNHEIYLPPGGRYTEFYNRKLSMLLRADALFTISDYGRQEGALNLNFPEEKISNISTAVEDMFRPEPIDALTYPA